MVTAPRPDRTLGAVLLHEHLRLGRITQEAFGALVGVTGVTVHRWIKGDDRPSFERARLIAQHTEGKVPAKSFFPELHDGLSCSASAA